MGEEIEKMEATIQSLGNERMEKTMEATLVWGIDKKTETTM